MKKIIPLISLAIISFSCSKAPKKPEAETNFIKNTTRIPDSVTVKYRGQQLYVPVYSHLRDADDEHDYPIASNISIRNTDPNQSIKILYLDYYNNNGEPIRNYLKEPVVLKPLASTYFVIRKYDLSGGLGANMLMEWECTNGAHPPLVESVMMNEAGTNNFTFTSRAVVLKSLP
jgi:hypothetical protein